MHLKSLTLRGFKSFAGTTRLILEPGITCIVGPNGSGKSNIVDALSWVMGEQGAKNLRGAAMSDIIFAGTTQRAGLGRAEVTLTIDNSDGALPIDYAEVTISRTLFRGGGSEYAINGTSCRLLDIQELLSDTGMGKQMHVIVGQGRLDAILSATPAQRRGYIEEAAGVLKHRRRRERAERKIAGMSEKLTRLEDLTAEVRRQLGPLSRQAALARRASVIQATELDARLRLLADDIVAARERLASHDDSAHVWLRKREEITALRDAQKTRLENLEEERKQESPRLRELTKLETNATTLVERYRATTMLLEERTRSLLSQEQKEELPDLTQLDRTVTRLEEEDHGAQKHVEECVNRREREREALAQALATQNIQRTKLQELEAQTLAVEKETAKLLAASSAAQAQMEAAQTAVSSAEKALKQAQERQQIAAAELATAPTIPADDQLGQTLNTLRSKRDEAKEEAHEHGQQLHEAEAKVAHWKARLDTLTTTLTALSQAATTTPDTDLTVLASEIMVTSGWETAIAAILGEFAHALVWENWAETEEWINRITTGASDNSKAQKAARQRGYAVIAAKATDPQVEIDALASAIIPARDLVQIKNPKLTAAVNELLNNHYCALELATAQEFVTAHPHVHVVTQNGVHLTAHSCAVSGSDNSAVHIQTAINEAEQQLSHFQEELEKARTAAENANTVATDLETQYEAQLNELRAADRKRAEIAQQLGALRSSATSADAEVKRRERELVTTKETLRCAQKTQAQAQEELAQAPQAPAKTVLAAQREALAEAENEVSQLQKRETDARVAEHQARDNARAAQQRARAARQNAANARNLITQRKRELAQRNARAKRLEKLQELTRKALTLTLETLTELSAKRQHVDDQLTQVNTQLEDSRALLEQLETQLQEIVATTHRDEVARAELVLAVEQCIRRLDEEGMNEEELLATYGPHVLVPNEDPELAPKPFNRREVEQVMRAAQKELKRLGAVNPLALEEHKAAQQRYDYLAGQLQDLKKSRSDLQGLLQTIDKRVKEAFAAAFADTQEQFAHVFATLFPGGTGRLILVDDPEGGEPGVEIEARPAGKNVKRLSLLSGGERSLAALAYVVAIFKARPSPFYVMDEVEAALDDANLGRILVLFEELRETSQLLIITHQKRTMEAADALYGISMRAGVSTVVSQRLSDKHS